MRSLIVYYSLTGNTRTIATALAAELDADIEEIRCNRYGQGAWNFLRAGFDSWRGSLPPIEPLTHSVDRYDLVAVAGPVWAWHPATPLRTFLHSERERLPRVAFLLTLGGAAGDRSLQEMERILGRMPVASLLVTEKDVKAQSFGPALSTFATRLRRVEAA